MDYFRKGILQIRIKNQKLALLDENMRIVTPREIPSAHILK